MFAEGKFNWSGDAVSVLAGFEFKCSSSRLLRFMDKRQSYMKAFRKGFRE